MLKSQKVRAWKIKSKTMKTDYFSSLQFKLLTMETSTYFDIFEHDIRLGVVNNIGVSDQELTNQQTFDWFPSQLSYRPNQE